MGIRIVPDLQNLHLPVFVNMYILFSTATMRPAILNIETKKEARLFSSIAFLHARAFTFKMQVSKQNINSLDGNISDGYNIQYFLNCHHLFS